MFGHDGRPTGAMAATGAFLVDLLAPVGRSERRHWGSVYVRGLLLNGERKIRRANG